MEALSAINLGTSKTAVEVSTGNSHACAILNDGGVKCCMPRGARTRAFRKLSLKALRSNPLVTQGVAEITEDLAMGR